jgi:hypothetical protein
MEARMETNGARSVSKMVMIALIARWKTSSKDLSLRLFMRHDILSLITVSYA